MPGDKVQIFKRKTGGPDCFLNHFDEAKAASQRQLGPVTTSVRTALVCVQTSQSHSAHASGSEGQLREYVEEYVEAGAMSSGQPGPVEISEEQQRPVRASKG